MSFLFGCIIFGTVTSILYLSDVTNILIKWPIAAASFLIGILIGLIYFLYFYKRSKILKAVRDLSIIFERDVSKLI